MRAGCIKRQMRRIMRWLKLKCSWSHEAEVCPLWHGKKLKRKQTNYCWESLPYFWLHKAVQLPGARSPCISCWSMNLFHSSNEAEITLGKWWTCTHLWCQTCFIFTSVGGTCAAWLGSMSLGKVDSVSGLTKLFLGDFFFLPLLRCCGIFAFLGDAAIFILLLLLFRQLWKGKASSQPRHKLWQSLIQLQ